MKQFLRYIFALATMLMMVVGNVWGECYVYGPSGEHSTTIGSNMVEFELPEGGAGGVLSYKYRLGKNANKTHYATAQYTTKSSPYEWDWEDLVVASTKSKNYEEYPKTATIPSDAKKIRFHASADFLGAQRVYVNEIKVTRVSFAKAPASSQLVLGPKIINSQASTASTTMEWSNISPFTWEITGTDANQFSASIETNAVADGCSHGTAKIIVTYKHDKIAPQHTATLKIKTNKGDYNINLSGTTLDKYTATFQWGLANTYLIDEWGNLVDIYSLTDKDGMDIKSQFRNSITFSSNNSNVVRIENGKIIAKNAGQATITAYFAGNNEWHSFTKTIVLTINKHTPVFTWNGKSVDVDQSVLYNTHYDNYFQSSSTKNLENTQFTYSSSNTDVATLSAGDAARSLDLTVYNKPSTITLTASQTENWYWYAKTETHTITPKHKDNHVPFKITTTAIRDIFDSVWVGDYYWDDGIQLGNWEEGGSYKDKYVILGFTGIPDKLTFNTSIRDAVIFPATGIKWYVKESIDGKTWSEEIWSIKGTRNVTLTDSIQLKPETRYILLCYSGNFGGVFHNINVTELNEFYAVETSDEETKTEIEHLYFNEEGKPNQIHATATRTFDIKYANAGYKVTAISNDNHFTVTPATTNQIGGEKHGLYTFTVNYTAREPYSTTDNNSYITITDEIGHKDIVYLHASSDKFHQTLRWKDEIAAVGEDKPYVVRKTVGEIINAAIASSDLTITYESTNTEVIKVEGTKLILVGPGETTITAKQNGNDLYYPADSISKPFVVTDKLLQYIIWNDAPTDIIKTDGTQQITLTAQVYVQTEDENNPFVLSPERTKALTYKSDNTNIVSVAGNILTVGNIGKTTLTAQVPETNEYAAAELTVPVTVRNETAGCEDILLYGPTEEPIQFFQYDLNEIVKEPIALDRTKGIPGYVELEHYGESWNLVIQYYAAEIRVEESVDGQNWTNKKTIYPVKNQINKDTINLSRNATHIRFVRNYGGQGYQFLQDIKVHPAQYIETYNPGSTTAIEEIDFGEIHVGSKNERSFDVHYSNIKSELSPVPSHSDITATPNFGYCGAFGTQTVKVTWTPSSVNDNAEETIRLWDQNSGMEKTVKLKARIKKGPQNINWSNWGGEAPTTISHCNLIEEFPTMTTADLPITWEVTAGNEFADFIAGTSQLQLIDNGTITLKASSKKTDTYLAFEQIFTITIEAKPIFHGTTDSNWDNVANWNFNRLPCEAEIATLQAPATLSSHATIAGLIFDENGKLHITSAGGMTIGAEGITNAAINGNSITIDNTREGAGFLRISPAYKGTMPYITMRYQTKSTLDSGANKDATWQYIGAPGEDCQFTVDHITWLYHWSEAQGWINKTGTLTLEPFAGYAITQYGKPTYELVSTVINEDKTITLTKTDTGNGMKGDNLFANSYSAPLDAKNFTPEDFSDYGKGSDDIVKTFYIFNSGSWNDWNKNQSNTLGNNNSNTPGQYRAIPALAAAYLNTKYDQTTISPMQGVYMIANTNGATITLNYDKHVWQAGNKGGTNMHEPMRAPGHNIYKPDNFRRLRIQVNSANSGADRMYVIQDTITTTDYDNGYDAPNQLAEGLANIYTNEHFGQMEVSCSNHIDSTFIGFTAGSDSIYTLRFNAIIGKDLHLYDLDNDSLILLEEDATYTFHATPQSKNDLRFQILLHPEKNLDFGTEEKDELYSGVTDVHTTQVWSHASYIYINNVPAYTIATLYNISGHKLLVTPIHQTPYTLDLSYLPKGVYMLQLNTQVYKFVIQ